MSNLLTIPTICVLCNRTFQAKTSYGICPNCFDRDKLREWDRLQSAIRLAHRQSLPVSLSLREWLAIVSDFQGRCAYCLDMPYSMLAMVHPTVGIVQRNVIPCCRACHVHLRGSFAVARERVQAYLEQERPGTDSELVYEPVDEPVTDDLGWTHV